MFAIDETSRLPVTAAIKRVLGSLCRDFGATVLVLAHPSKASILDGSHYSGSTAFNNAVRQRLTLEIEKDSGNIGPPPRRLKVAKSNYGAQDELRLIDRLREARIDAGLTQSALAVALDRPQSFIAKVEGYERRLDLMEFILIANALNQSPGELLREK